MNTRTPGSTCCLRPQTMSPYPRCSWLQHTVSQPSRAYINISVYGSISEFQYRQGGLPRRNTAMPATANSWRNTRSTEVRISKCDLRYDVARHRRSLTLNGAPYHLIRQTYEDGVRYTVLRDCRIGQNLGMNQLWNLGRLRTTTPHEIWSHL